MEKLNKYEGKLHIISDEKFFALLTDAEYQLFIGLKVIARHDKNGQSYLYDNQVNNFSALADNLKLAGRVEGTTIDRKTIAKTFKSLVSKGVLTKKECLFENDGEVYGGYELINENKMNYKFARINNELLKAMKLVFKGNILKLYVYLKANFDYNKSNGNETYFKRETLAKAINEVSRKGEVGKRQLENITLMLRVLYTMGLVDIKHEKYMSPDGTFKEKLKIVNVTDELKNFRR